LDGFKAINDTLGHEAGDEALRGVANALRAARRESDRQYRLGGDEFVLLLPHTDERGARKAAVRYRKAIESLVMPEGLRLGASVGVATYPVDGNESDNLMNLADSRMYKVKHQNKKSEASAESEFTPRFLPPPTGQSEDLAQAG
jgi:diguanylate cyclase (GGDEF)-like protein